LSNNFKKTERNLEILALYEAGVPLKVIAFEHGVKAQRISAIVHSIGVANRRYRAGRVNKSLLYNARRITRYLNQVGAHV
jgi:hypothetical protein